MRYDFLEWEAQIRSFRIKRWDTTLSLGEVDIYITHKSTNVTKCKIVPTTQGNTEYTAWQRFALKPCFHLNRSVLGRCWPQDTRCEEERPRDGTYALTYIYIIYMYIRPPVALANPCIHTCSAHLYIYTHHSTKPSSRHCSRPHFSWHNFARLYRVYKPEASTRLLNAQTRGSEERRTRKRDRESAGAGNCLISWVRARASSPIRQPDVLTRGRVHCARARKARAARVSSQAWLLMSSVKRNLKTRERASSPILWLHLAKRKRASECIMYYRSCELSNPSSRVHLLYLYMNVFFERSTREPAPVELREVGN